MSERFQITRGDAGALFNKVTAGHGSAGQVKKAGHFGRSVKVQGQRLNANSLIDFLNTQATPDKQLKKGWFLGYGGSSNKEIKALFDELYPSIGNNNVDNIPSSQNDNNLVQDSRVDSQSESRDEEKEEILATVKQNGAALQFANDEYKDNEEVVLAAVEQTPFALEFASDRLKNDRAFVRKAMKPHVH